MGCGGQNAEPRPPGRPESGGGEHAVERFGWTYRVGDKVMQTQNDYDKEIYNGDLGFVTGIDLDVQ
ncbi:RecD-like DNA helicase YrrC [Azospirillum doebereinerae]